MLWLHLLYQPVSVIHVARILATQLIPISLFCATIFTITASLTQLSYNRKTLLKLKYNKANNCALNQCIINDVIFLAEDERTSCFSSLYTEAVSSHFSESFFTLRIFFSQSFHSSSLWPLTGGVKFKRILNIL